jgi:hypothetical protein
VALLVKNFFPCIEYRTSLLCSQPPLDPVLSQMNSFYTHITYLIQIRFNDVLKPTLWSSKSFLPIRFYTYNFIRISHRTMHGICPVHFIFLELVVPIIFCEQSIVLRNKQAGLRLEWLKFSEIDKVRQCYHIFLCTLCIFEPK